MQIILEILETILTSTGIFAFIYVGAYVVELAKQKVRKKLLVCDNCFSFLKEVKEKIKS